MWRYIEKTSLYRKGSSSRTWPSWHPNLRLSASRTVRNQCLLFKPHSLRYSVKGAWAKTIAKVGSGKNHQWKLNIWKKFWWGAGHLHCLKISPHRLLILCKQKNNIKEKMHNTLTKQSNGHHVPLNGICWEQKHYFCDILTVDGIMSEYQWNTNGGHFIIKKGRGFIKKKSMSFKSNNSWETVPDYRRPKRPDSKRTLLDQLIKLVDEW